MSHPTQRRLETGAVYKLLSSSERRRILLHLRDRDEATVDALTEAIVDADEGPSDERQVAISLVHNHLPRLDDAGVVDYDRDRNVAARGERFGDVDDTASVDRDGSVGAALALLE